jgi:GDPmannose 4,6-dehydratase
LKTALITGITGQDGSYLAELLLSKGYMVHGIIRRASTFNTGRIDHIYLDPHVPESKLRLHYGDLSDGEQISNIVYNSSPDEVYHLGAQSHVKVSFEIPEYTANVTALGALRVLQALRRKAMPTKFYQASSSEMFGNAPPPQNENTPLRPRSPYAISKSFAHQIVGNYREAYSLFASNGVLFNHESPRRGEIFVTRKITRAVGDIMRKKQTSLFLGNLDAMRDWGYAPEYVEAVWRILQLEKPDDFVLGTGEAHSVREFVEEAFSYAGLDYSKHVKIDSRYFRPTETDLLVADSTKAKRVLNWAPKVKFKELVRIMVDADMRKVGLEPPGEGDESVARLFPQRWWNVD